MAKWLPPDGFTGKVHEMDAHFGGTYRERAPDERIRYLDKFDDPDLPGEIEVTITCANCRAGPN